MAADSSDTEADRTLTVRPGAEPAGVVAVVMMASAHGVDHAADLRALLRLPDFRRLLRVRLLSQLSDGVFQVALAAYVVFSPEKQATPGAVASAMAVLLLPYSLLGPFAGVLLDRWRRRQVLLYGNLLRACCSACGTGGLVLLRVPDWLFFLSALSGDRASTASCWPGFRRAAAAWSTGTRLVDAPTRCRRPRAPWPRTWAAASPSWSSSSLPGGAGANAALWCWPPCSTCAPACPR